MLDWLTPTCSATSATERLRLIRASRRWRLKLGLRANALILSLFETAVTLPSKRISDRQGAKLSIRGEKFAKGGSGSYLFELTDRDDHTSASGGWDLLSNDDQYLLAVLTLREGFDQRARPLIASSTVLPHARQETRMPMLASRDEKQN